MVVGEDEFDPALPAAEFARSGGGCELLRGEEIGIHYTLSEIVIIVHKKL